MKTRFCFNVNQYNVIAEVTNYSGWVMVSGKGIKNDIITSIMSDIVKGIRKNKSHVTTIIKNNVTLSELEEICYQISSRNEHDVLVAIRQVGGLFHQGEIVLDLFL